MANFEVVRVRLPEYETLTIEPATLVCDFKFTQHRRRRCCPCRRKTDVQNHTLEATPDIPRAGWRSFDKGGLQIALFSIDMRSKKKFIRSRIVDSMSCVATVSRNVLDDIDGETSPPQLMSPTTSKERRQSFSKGTSHSATQESSKAEKLFKAYGDIGDVLSSKGGVSRLVGSDAGQVVELQFRTPQTHSFKFERCQPRQKSHLILECWVLHKRLDKGCHQGTSTRFPSRGGHKPLLKRHEDGTSLGTRLFHNLERLWTFVTVADEDKEEDIEREFDEWRPCKQSEWRRLWDCGHDMVQADRLRRGVSVTDVMEVQFRKDAVLLYNTLFPKVSLLALLGLVCACAPNLLQEDDPIVERCRQHVNRMRDTGLDGPKLRRVLDATLRSLAAGSGGLSKLSRSFSTSSRGGASKSFQVVNSSAPSVSESTETRDSPKQLLSSGSKQTLDGSAKNALDAYALTVLFMKRLLICLALCDVRFAEEDNLPALGEAYPFPLASLFGHGNRIMLRLEEVDVYDFLNILFKGDPRAHDWRKRGVPSPFSKRMAASHAVNVEDGFLKERLLQATSATDVVGNLSDGLAGRHLGLDLPLGGLGNATPIWKMGLKTPACVGFRGEAVLEDKYTCKAGIQGGHLYIRIDEHGDLMRGGAWHVPPSDDIDSIFDLSATVPSKTHQASKSNSDDEVKRRNKRIRSCPARIPHGNFNTVPKVEECETLDLHASEESPEPRSPGLPTPRTPKQKQQTPWLWKALQNFGTVPPPPSVSSMKALLEACGVCSLTEKDLEALFQEMQTNHAILELQPGFRIIRVMRKVILNIQCQECSLLNVAMQVRSESSELDASTGSEDRNCRRLSAVEEFLNHSQPKFVTTVVRLPKETEVKAALRAMEENLPTLLDEIPKAQIEDFLRSSENWQDQIDDRESKVFPGLTCHRCTRIYRINADRTSWFLRALERASFLNPEGDDDLTAGTIYTQRKYGQRITLLWKWISLSRVEMMGYGSLASFTPSEFVDQEDEMWSDAYGSSSMPQSGPDADSLQKRRNRSRRSTVLNTEVVFRKVSSLLIGLESSAPNRKSPIGQAHDAKAVSNTFSSMNNWKWRYYRKYNALQIPADIGGLRVNINKRRLRLVKEVLDCLDILNPTDDWLDPPISDSSLWQCRHSLNQRHIEEVLFQDILSQPMADARSAVLAYAGECSRRSLKRGSIDRYGLELASREVRDKAGYHKCWKSSGVTEHGIPRGHFDFMVSIPEDRGSTVGTITTNNSSMKGSDTTTTTAKKRQSLISARTLSVAWSEKIEESANLDFGHRITDEYERGVCPSLERTRFKAKGQSLSFLQRQKGHISLADCLLEDPRMSHRDTGGDSQAGEKVPSSVRFSEASKASGSSSPAWKPIGSLGSRGSSEDERRYCISEHSQSGFFDDPEPCDERVSMSSEVAIDMVGPHQDFASEDVDSSNCDCIDGPDADSLKIKISARQHDKQNTDAIVATTLRNIYASEELPDTTDPIVESELEAGTIDRSPDLVVCLRCHTPRGATVPAGSASSTASYCCVCNIYMAGGAEGDRPQMMLQPSN